jgi:vacuolar-type H+-ATPase subunit D/Vma8
MSELEKMRKALELVAQDRDSMHAKLDKLIMVVSDIDEEVEELGVNMAELTESVQEVVFEDAYPGSGDGVED